MNKILLVVFMLASALNALAGIEVSTTLPKNGTPEHRYTMVNGNGYYCNATTSPTQTSANYATFAFYAGTETGSYYIYNVTAQKWVSYTKKASYDNQTGFVQLTEEKQEAAIYKFTEINGGAYQIQPYNTTGVAAKYLNWLYGPGTSNPVDGEVTLGIWEQGGNQDAGSKWFFKEVGVTHKYTLFSDGMPSTASVTIKGQTFTGLNAQGSQSISIEGDLQASDVKVNVGNGCAAKVTIDNANYQVDFKFVQFFNPTESVDAEVKYSYLLHMPQAYIKMINNDLHHTTTRGEADKFIFIEDAKNLGKYYIYDLSANCYLYYTSTNNGSGVDNTSQSNVRYTTNISEAKTWQLYYLSDETVAIIPGEIADPTSSSASLNFTGGIGNNKNKVLNLWSADDSNSAWQIIDPTAGSMPCATLMYALPGAPFIHKLVPNQGETVTSVDFGTDLPGFELKEDRLTVGNRYKYVSGTAPTTEGEYVYTVKTRAGDSEEETSTKVRLIVDEHMQSPTPMMAWLTWNWFARSISHEKMVEIAKGLEKHGLIKAGFNTIVLDDAWAVNTTDKNALNYDANKFPKGISGLKEDLKKINDKLKVGIYSDAGSLTCENYQPGSFGYEEQHIKLFDEWGVDMLKYDFCNHQASAKISYSQMGKVIAALNKKRKTENKVPFVFNICEWGQNQPWTWGAEVGGSSWRATSDAREDWIGTSSLPGVIGGVDAVRRLWMYAGVNRFNDLDMMCIGLHGLGGPSNHIASHPSNGGTITGLNEAQARSQMSLWCMFASPLALTCDLRETPQGEANSGVTVPKSLITDADIKTLTNAEILAINQDKLGQQAEYMESISTGRTDYSNTGYDVYVKDLEGGRMAVSVTNRGGSAITGPTLNLTDLYLQAGKAYNCHDIWADTDNQIENQLVVGTLNAYETKVYVIAEGSTNYLKSLTAALNSAKSVLDKNAEYKGKPFYCSTEAYNALQEVYNQYKDNTTATQEDVNAVNTAITTFNSSAISTSQIQDGTEVLLGNQKHSLYVYAKEIKRTGDKGGFLGSGSAKDSYRYLFTIKTASAGKYKIYSNYYKKYVGAIPTEPDREFALVEEANAGEFTIDAASYGFGFCRIYDANCNYKSGSTLVNALHMCDWTQYNIYGNGVVRWEKESDASAFKLIYATEDIKTAWDNALALNLQEAKKHAGTCIGDYNAEAITAAEAAFNAATEKSTVAKATDDALLAARVAPAAGKYYTISNATQTDKFISENYKSQTSGGENKLIAAVKEANIMPTLWRFQQLTAAGQTDLYKIIAANSGKCMSKAAEGYTMHVTATNNANAGAFDIFTKDAVNKEHAVSLVTYTDLSRANRGTACIKDDFTEINSQNDPNANNNFLVQEVAEIPVAISAARYATLNLPCAVTVNGEVEAYIAADGENEVTLSAIENGVIPANTPVILVGNEGSYNFTINTDNTAEAISSALTGTLVPTTIAANATAYILKKGAQGIGMYKITSETDRTIAANKAYMSSTTATASNMKVFNFGGISTSINNAVVGNAENNVYYDLNGRRVLYPAHGVFVKANGEKVYIK